MVSAVSASLLGTTHVVFATTELGVLWVDKDLLGIFGTNLDGRKGETWLGVLSWSSGVFRGTKDASGVAGKPSLLFFFKCFLRPLHLFLDILGVTAGCGASGVMGEPGDRCGVSWESVCLVNHQVILFCRPAELFLLANTFLLLDFLGHDIEF